MQYILDVINRYPSLALMLTVGLGFLLGRLKYKAFTLGSVTATLIIGIIVGQSGIEISSQIKNMFFMLFLFSVGYSVGPGFFRSLRGTGLRQVLFAVVLSFICAATTVLLAIFMNYNSGEAVGLFAGSQTCSSVIGVGSEAIRNSLFSPQVKKTLTDIIPVCYAVTYVYGTLGTVIILGTFGPKLLGGLPKVKADTQKLQAQFSHNPWRDDPAYVSALNEVSFRVYVAENETVGQGTCTVAQLEAQWNTRGLRLFIDKVLPMHAQKYIEAAPDLVINHGDRVVVCGRTMFLTRLGTSIGREVTDLKLLDYPVKQAPVLLRNSKIAGHTLQHLLNRRFMHGVLLKEVVRNGSTIPLHPAEILQKGDTLTIVGRKRNLNRAADRIGHLDTPTTQTDIMFLALAVFIGGVIGTLTVVVDAVPLSFGTSGGALIAGLVFGWARTKRPTFGYIPKSVVWLLNQLGLNVFIAAVGINSGPTFISGIQQVGWALPLVGIVATTVPLLIGLWLGHRVFKMHPAFTLGCIAGTRTCTASLGAVQDTLNSTLPTMGYAVTYAVSNVLLLIWGTLAVAIV